MTHRCHPDWCDHPEEPDPLLACTCGAPDYRVCGCGSEETEAANTEESE